MKNDVLLVAGRNLLLPRIQGNVLCLFEHVISRRRVPTKDVDSSIVLFE